MVETTNNILPLAGRVQVLRRIPCGVVCWRRCLVHDAQWYFRCRLSSLPHYRYHIDMAWELDLVIGYRETRPQIYTSLVDPEEETDVDGAEIDQHHALSCSRSKQNCSRSRNTECLFVEVCDTRFRATTIDSHSCWWVKIGNPPKGGTLVLERKAAPALCFRNKELTRRLAAVAESNIGLRMRGILVRGVENGVAACGDVDNAFSVEERVGELVYDLSERLGEWADMISYAGGVGS